MKITEGITILSLTLYAYMAVYFYEVGYFRAYGIPIELINPSISNFLKVGSVGLAILAVLFQVLNLFHLIVNEKLPDSPYKTLLSKHGIYVTLGLLVTIQSYFYLSAVIYFLLFPLLYLFMDVILPFFEKGKYSENLAHWLNFQVKNPEKNLINAIINKDNEKPIILIFFGLYTMAALANFGYGEALRKDTFLVADDYAVLKVYGTQAITAKYNEKSKELLPEYKVVDITSIKFKLVKLGELRKKDEK